MGKVVVLFAVVAIWVVLIATVTPVAVLAFGIWLLFRRPTLAKCLGPIFVVGSVVLGLWLWPLEYVFFFRSADVPDVKASTPASAREQLAYEGFLDLSIISGDPSNAPPSHATRPSVTSGSCQVAAQTPNAGKHSDKRTRIVLVVNCPLAIDAGFAQVPNVIGKPIWMAKDDLTRAALYGSKVVGYENDRCEVVSSKPTAGRVVRLTVHVILKVHCK
jgi:beta-lactam-binding protein with PASTA domain